MPEVHIPCILDANKSCVKVDLELPQTKVIDEKTINQLAARFQITESQAEFCADCLRTETVIKEIR